MEKILDIVEAIAHEKNITKEEAIEAFKEALINTAKRLTTQTTAFEVKIDFDTKSYIIHKVVTVVADGDAKLYEEVKQGGERKLIDSDGFIPLSEALTYDDSLEVGDKLEEEFNLEAHGRTASANLFRELEYHIQRRIEQNLFEKYKNKIGTIIIGTVTRVDSQENTFIEVGELKGILSLRNRIKGEKFKPGDTIKALLRYVSTDPHHGLFLELTRTAPKFLEELMRKEVPEIEDGAVTIVTSARIPGERAKLALKAEVANVDPIGAAVGVKGVRINAVSEELCGENIDCVEYSPIEEIFLNRALSPAIPQHISVAKEEDNENKEKEKKALIKITSDQKAKAIGRSGINIRLASMLTGYTIELEEVEGITQPTTPSNEATEVEKTTDTSALADLFK
jgi:N utilization substance protein A